MKKFVVTFLLVLTLSLMMALPAFAIVHDFVPADLPSQGGGGQAIANDGIDPPGEENDGVNNPAGVGAPVPKNNPGQGSPGP